MKTLRNIYIGIVYFLLYLPIIVLVVMSFNTSKTSATFTGFTFEWYTELFSDADLLGLVRNTLILAVVSSVIAVIIGTMAALGICKMKKKLRSVVLAVTNIPMTNPDIVTGISLALVFVFIGAMFKFNSAFSFWTLLIAHVTFNLPYVILSVMPRIARMDRNLTDAALDLGSTPLQSFFKVTLPEIMPGIISGFTMAITLSLDDFVISYFVSDSSFITLPIDIYSQTKKQMSPKYYALFTLMFVLILALLILVNVLEIRREKKQISKLNSIKY